MPREYTRTPIERFTAKYIVNEVTGCWEWTACVAGRYCGFAVGCTKQYAHRWSYTYHKGEIPKGMVVCHTCDNPKCVNPDHLWIGTYWDNMQDAKAKGRTKTGPPTSRKLTPTDVLNIRAEPKTPRNELSERYNVSIETVDQIRSGRKWKRLLVPD